MMIGMGNRQGLTARMALLTLALFVTLVPVMGTSAAPPVAAIGGTGELALHESSESIVKVAYQEVTGFANTLFQATDPAHPPYFIAGEPGCQRVALIFNVGVGYEPAAGILDTLAAEGVPATMFVMGWWAAEHPAILTRMANEGYPIGSHGDQSYELTGLSDSEVAADVANAAAAIEHAIGQPPAPYFTPYAAATDERVRAIVDAAGYLNVGWEVSAVDYGADATADGVYDRVMGAMYDGAIVELHLDGPASAESTGAALPLMIRDLRAQGYQFVTIPEMAWPCP